MDRSLYTLTNAPTRSLIRFLHHPPFCSPFLCILHHPLTFSLFIASFPSRLFVAQLLCFLMEINDSISLSACRKRKQETKAECACKHVKPGPQTLAPDRLAPNMLDSYSIDKSCMPLQFLYMNKGRWEVYARGIATALSVCLAARKETATFLFSGQIYLVDFAHMVQLNMQTGYARSVAWIDDTGKCFSPHRCFEGGIGQFLLLSQQTSHQIFQETGFESHLGNRLSTLANDDQEFLTIKEKFICALGSLAKYTSVVGIHRCSFEGTSAQVRLETFQRHEQAVRAARGNANVRYAWHGTSKKGILGIISHGFGQPAVPKHGANYGSGVYLAPEGKSFLSAVYSDVDEDGAQHMLLCKVILGDIEQVREGSKQFSPSSEDHDTGADDVASPSRYIVWSTHMNTHILPLYVVSFKLAPSLRDLVMSRKRREDASRLHCLCSRASSSVQDREEVHVLKKACDDEASKNGALGDALFIDVRKAPQSPWISFPDLFLRMQKNLSPVSLMTLQLLHSEFRVGRLPRKTLVKLIRAISGDAILWQCIMGKTADSPSGLSSCGEGRDGS